MTDQNRNLIVRLTTAFVLLPLVLYLIYLGGLPFTLLICVAAAAAAYELNALPYQAKGPALALAAVEPLADAETRKQRKKFRAAAREQVEQQTGASFPGAAIASVGAAFLLPLLDQAPIGWLSFKLVLTGLVMLSLTDALLFEPEVSRAPQRVGLAVLGACYPGLLLSALVRLRQMPEGAWWIVLTLVVTWFNDTGGYFTGRAFGKHKLYPRISPSKTWEGALGGMCASVGGAVAVKLLFLPALPIWAAAAIGAGGSVLGPLGDLSESMLKRAYGAKDSGKLLPGHGGFLDRIDALIFNAPFVLLCARLFAG